MRTNEAGWDEEAARIYRAAAEVRDEALRELVKNAASTLGRAESEASARQALGLARRLLDLAGGAPA